MYTMSTLNYDVWSLRARPPLLPRMNVQQQQQQHAYVYPQWNQLSTATGRLSTSNPSFQNLPRDAVTIDRETIVNIRKCFICRNESAVLVRFDYSQFEMRILASHVGKHSNLYQLFDGGINSDIYRTCASKILKKPDMFASTYNFGSDMDRGTEPKAA